MRTDMRRANMLRREGHFLGALTGGAVVALPVHESDAQASGTDSATVAKPVGTESGDLLLAQVTIENDNAITPPSGFTSLRADGTNFFHRQEIFYKVAGASEPVDYMFSSTGQMLVGMARISGADPDAPINAHGGDEGDTSTSVVAPSITTTVDKTLIYHFGSARTETTFTPPDGYTEHWDQNMAVRPTQGAFQTSQEEAGATGTATATLASGDRWSAAHVAVAPA